MEKRSERRTESRPPAFLIIFTDREPEKRCTYDVMSSVCERLGPFADILVSLYSRGVSYKWTQNHR